MKLKELKDLLESGEDNVDVSKLLSKPEPEKIAVVPDLVIEIPIKGAVAHVKHSCNPGDMIASMAACKKYWETTGRKVKYLQKVNQPAQYYNGATHGTVDEGGAMVTLNKPMFDMMKPLIESQEYIDSMEIYEGQRVDIDFDVIRGKTFVNMPHGSIQAWLFFAFPDLEIDISKEWMFLKPERKQIEQVTKGKVVINFTERYRNNQIMLDYFFLREYAPDLIFAGTEQEHFKFTHQWGLNIPRLQVKDFLELAYALRGARFLLSNQSMIWNLSTAIGVPRVLEVCPYAQNCLTFYGKDNKGFFHQAGLGYYFRDFYNLYK